MEQENNFYKEAPIHWGHFAMIVGVAVALLGVTWLKNPQGFFPKAQPVAERSDIPKYYAYVEPAMPDGPRVAGASTVNPDLPSVLNEDGSVTPTISVGDVLGVSTNDLESMAAQLKITEIPDSDAAIKDYMAWTQAHELDAIDSTGLENALSSADQQQLDVQAAKFQKIKDDLLARAVPQSLAKLHKLKILQYQAGINLFKSFTKADDNPEQVQSDLGIFTQAQQEMENEAAQVEQKYAKLLDPQIIAAEQAAQEGGAK
ncbi:MAG: hypothetical protein M1400_01180 [Patescibacteria group bacterium]|nr:hypothetical protein [Patescibacteria group bacterium]